MHPIRLNPCHKGSREARVGRRNRPASPHYLGLSSRSKLRLGGSGGYPRFHRVGADGLGSVVTFSGALKGNVAGGPASYGWSFNIGVSVTTSTDVVTFFVPVIDFGSVPATGDGTVPRFKFTGLGGVELGAFRVR